MCSVQPRWLTGWTCGGTRAAYRVTPHFAEEKSTLTETFAPLHIYIRSLSSPAMSEAEAFKVRHILYEWEWDFFCLPSSVCFVHVRSFRSLCLTRLFSFAPQTILSALSSSCPPCSAGDNSWLWVSAPPMSSIPHVYIHTIFMHGIDTIECTRTLNVIQCISITVLTLPISVICSQSQRRLAALGGFCAAVCFIWVGFSRGKKMEFSQEDSLPTCFSSQLKIKGWGWQVATTTSNTVFVTRGYKAYGKQVLILCNVCTRATGCISHL